MKARRSMIQRNPADAGQLLQGVRCPVLNVMGEGDPDWVDAEGEGEGAVGGLPEGMGHIAMVRGAGHCPRRQRPGDVADLVLDFAAGAAAGA